MKLNFIILGIIFFLGTDILLGQKTQFFMSNEIKVNKNIENNDAYTVEAKTTFLFDYSNKTITHTLYIDGNVYVDKYNYYDIITIPESKSYSYIAYEQNTKKERTIIAVSYDLKSINILTDNEFYIYKIYYNETN